MFTIRWIFSNGGPDKTQGEELYATKRISQCEDGKLHFTRDDDHETSGVDTVIDVGDVYVMNEAGKTVASYFFNNPAPVVGEPA